jgi:hypothetical protein
MLPPRYARHQPRHPVSSAWGDSACIDGQHKCAGAGDAPEQLLHRVHLRREAAVEADSQHGTAAGLDRSIGSLNGRQFFHGEAQRLFNVRVLVRGERPQNECGVAVVPVVPQSVPDNPMQLEGYTFPVEFPVRCSKRSSWQGLQVWLPATGSITGHCSTLITDHHAA